MDLDNNQNPFAKIECKEHDDSKNTCRLWLDSFVNEDSNACGLNTKK